MLRLFKFLEVNILKIINRGRDIFIIVEKNV